MSKVPEHYFLYAEDDPDDQLLFREIVQKVSPDYEVVIREQGLALMQYLEALQPGDHMPCCIVLDINMPVWDGTRTLKEIKEHPVFRVVPVVMFTTSQSKRDIAVCSELGADDFLSKPVTRTEFERIMQTFASYCARTLQTRN